VAFEKKLIIQKCAGHQNARSLSWRWSWWCGCYHSSDDGLEKKILKEVHLFFIRMGGELDKETYNIWH